MKKSVYFKLIAGAGVAILLLLLKEFFLPLQFPQVEGRFEVGLSERIVVDSTRSEETFANGKRNLLISIFYPVDRNHVANHKSPYFPETKHFRKNLARVLGTPAFLLTKLPASHYYISKAGISKKEAFPVIIFSHGLSGYRLQNTLLCRRLASDGFIVVAIEHHGYSSGSIFPEGPIGNIFLENLHNNQALANAIINEWTSDHIAVKNYLLNALQDENDSLLFKNMDSSKMGLLGHSFGGASSFNTITLDTTFSAAANMDGYYFGKHAGKGSSKPLLELRSAPIAATALSDKQLRSMQVNREQYHQIMFEDFDRLFLQYARGEGYRFMLKGSNHFSFTDIFFFLPFKYLLIPGHDEQRKLYEALVNDFFNYSLKDADTFGGPFQPGAGNDIIILK
ncbi:MAG TPA: dienelactone hydrolase family protein [Cyclobacteriaceae bacterium]|nr:dienelactone hydrolase family protein [Cyclobacteriaceae bacterium]